MQDRFKFRVWCENNQEWDKDTILISNKDMYEIRNDKFTKYTNIDPKNHIINFCTGLRDKNGLNRLFEYDIIDGEGIKIGNYYENKDLLKTTTNYLIKRMGTKEWRNSEQEAIKRGCFYAE